MPAEFGRLLTAMITPMREDGAVDYERAADLAKALVDSGNEGLVIAGSTGEGITLTAEEKIALWAAIRRALPSDVAVIAGSTNSSTAESIALSREAERVGCDGLLLTVPAYNKPPQEGLVRHFTAIADATGLPCMLYNVPVRTALNMTAETMLRLAEHPRIVGVKEASGDFAQIGRVIAGAPSGFRVWSGNDSDTLGVMAMGGYGIVSVAGHLVGRQIRQLIDACLRGDLGEAAALHHRLTPLVDVLFIESNPIPVKQAMHEVGFAVGAPRLPLLPASEGATARIRAELARQQIDVRVPAPAR
ncbi:MAG: 4-hydroxy-tetrahydrodipicolinate synthase [Dehalococcoidia bacterium]|nr:4-hydroxy-tetrahydrodipicolinate synthase [Dehalococcoidia bacterium]